MTIVFRREAIITILVLVAFACSTTHAAVICVDGVNGDDSSSGKDWATAKKTIQAGVNVAGTDYEVWVAAATYLERVTLKSSVRLYGGFPSGGGAWESRNRTANPTIIDGNQGGSVVTSPSSAVASTKIDGFTIRNGKASNGGGICCTSSSPAISHNVITGNASINGGGIYCSSSSSPWIFNNNMTGNASISGGGIYCSSSSSPLVFNNAITGNSSSDGGGIYCSSSSSPLISSNAITGNASINGGGVYCDNYSSVQVISNNTIASNTASSNGGGIYHYSSSFTISNNIVAFNSSGIYRRNTPGGTPTLRNNCVYRNADYDYAGIAPGTGDISVDPLLADRAYGNVHIREDSPCRNAGWNETPGRCPTDVDGDARIQDGTIDIGSDESDGTMWPPGPYVVVRVGPDGDDGNDGSSWPLAKRTLQAGINMASALGGTVWAKAGVYNERLVLHPYAYVYGGFAGSESTRSEREWVGHVTTIDGGAAGSVVSCRAGYQLSTIDGFTIRNGYAELGGGIYCDDSSPTISNNIIKENTAYWSGGGIACNYSSPDISNNTLSGNGAYWAGGGVFCIASSPAISNNTVTANGSEDGGGIYCYAGSPAIFNNTITGNSAESGGGIKCENSTPNISNNIVAFNSSGIYGYRKTPTLRSNCVYNPSGYNYSGLTAGTTDIQADPQLVSAEYGRVHIQPGSPCVDVGNDTMVTSAWLDMDGQARVQGLHVDVGADESDGTSWTFAPTVIRVSPSGNDANDGSSWALAKKTVQAGTDVATDVGGEVWVAAGTYGERIRLKTYAHLYGGFAGNETLLSQRDRMANVTILDGGGAGSVVRSEAAGHQTCGIDGFTIRNGNTSNAGGGISCYISSPTISNNTITGNTGVDGGGISCDNSSPTISNNTITGNSVDSGGGIYCDNSSPTVSNNTVTGNSAAGGGGGIYCISSYPTISGNMITGNDAEDGGGIYSYSFSSAITNNTVAGNTASGNGGGVYCDGSQSPLISNNIVAFNSSGVFKSDSLGGTPSLRSNCIYNPGGNNYANLSPGIGDISVDPMLVDRISGNYHISSSSTCVNAGWNDAQGLSLLDIDGQARMWAGVVDIGADEWWPGTGIAKRAPDGLLSEPNDVVVTAVFADCFYVESPDRSCGIRVTGVTCPTDRGMVRIVGTIHTNSAGERYVEATSVTRTGPGELVPLGMTNRALGGGGLFYEPSTGAGQRGIASATGSNNIGLLVRTWGKVTVAGRGWFYVDDGSGVADGSGIRGVYVDASGLPVPTNGAMVAVTGISSCDLYSGSPVNTLLATAIDTIQAGPVGVRDATELIPTNPRGRAE